MKIIITCEPEAVEAATRLAKEQIADNWQERYNKPGWGWFFRDHPHTDFRFFVRGIRNGISVTQKEG